MSREWDTLFREVGSIIKEVTDDVPWPTGPGPFDSADRWRFGDWGDEIGWGGLPPACVVVDEDSSIHWSCGHWKVTLSGQGKLEKLETLLASYMTNQT